MDDLIQRLEQIADNLETLAWLLKENEDHGPSIKGTTINYQVEIYADTEYFIRDVFKELKENHGSKFIS